MERMYTIGGEKLRLKASLYTAIAYKAAFGSELIGDLERAAKLVSGSAKRGEDTEAKELYVSGAYLYLRALYIFACEGSAGELPLYDDWLKGIGGVDLADVISVVSELYSSTLKPDRKNV